MTTRDLDRAITTRNLPAALEALRGALGITWEGLAAELETSKTTVLRWRRGSRGIWVDPWPGIERLRGVLREAEAGDEECMVALRAMRDAWRDGRRRQDD